MEESRMDKIEKGMAEFFQGMREMRTEFFQEMQEMRKFQKETGVQIMKLKESQEKTDAHLMKLKESQEKTDVHLMKLKESQEKTDAQLMKLKESQEKTDVHLMKLKESQEKTDDQFRRTDEKINDVSEQLAKTIKKLDNIGEQLGDMGLVQGKVAEDLFYRNVKSLFRDRDMMFASVRRNVRKKGVAEYDIVAADKDRVLVIEVKNRLERRMVDRFVAEKLPLFRKVFPQYKDCAVIGGMGALVLQDDVGRYAEKKGLYVLTQSGDGGAMLANRKNFRAREFS
ncbi:MAG: hypothetical protein AB7S75_20555 [Desulfococcaceae bacterium]